MTLLLNGAYRAHRLSLRWLVQTSPTATTGEYDIPTRNHVFPYHCRAQTHRRTSPWHTV